MSKRFKIFMNIFVLRCLRELSMPSENDDRIWGHPGQRGYDENGIISNREKCFQAGSFLDRENIIPLLNRVSSPFLPRGHNRVIVFPIMEEILREFMTNPENILIAEHLETLGPEFGRSRILIQIGEQYVRNCKMMLYGAKKPFQGKKLFSFLIQYFFMMPKKAKQN